MFSLERLAMHRPVPFLAAALLSVSALTPLAARGAPKDTSEPISVQVQPYGAYLVGREALAGGDDHEATAVLESLAATYPGEPALQREAFLAALRTGDIPGAARLAPREATAEDGGLESLGRIVRATEDLADKRAAQADALIDPARITLPYRTAAVMLKPWTEAAAGNWTAAFAEPDTGGDRLAGLVVKLSQARLAEIKGRTADAEKIYKSLVEGDLSGALAKVPYGEFLERHDRSAEAKAIYEAALKADPDNHAVREAMARLTRGGRPPAAPDLAKGAAEAFTYAAAASSVRHGDLGLVYTRLALRLDPTLDEAWMVLGEELSQGHHATEARDAWGKVRQASRFWADARSHIAFSLSQSGDPVGAIKLARATADTLPRDVQSQLTLADLLRGADQDAEALAVLDHAVKSGGEGDWRVRYMRAMAYDKLGRWNDAEPELVATLKLAPDEPDVENYLGYSWIDHGVKIKEGLALVEKAQAANPNSGAIQDSVGWAHYRMADYAGAVTLLEKAVELEPADPSINDHLGDAYWMAGRKVEAGYQWNRVLSLDPEKALKASAERKVREGLVARVAAG
jgi:Flp pilus assembly protein TadD